MRRSTPGLVSIAGGKYTTYRIMARDAVDVAARDLPFFVPPSRTEDLPLLGAVGFDQAARRAQLHPGAAGVDAAAGWTRPWTGTSGSTSASRSWPRP